MRFRGITNASFRSAKLWVCPFCVLHLGHVSLCVPRLPSSTHSWLQSVKVDTVSVDSNCLLTPQGAFVLCVWNMAKVYWQCRVDWRSVKKRREKSAATEICEVCRTGFLQVTATAVASYGEGSGGGGSCTVDPRYTLSLSFKTTSIWSSGTSHKLWAFCAHRHWRSNICTQNLSSRTSCNGMIWGWGGEGPTDRRVEDEVKI